MSRSWRSLSDADAMMHSIRGGDYPPTHAGVKAAVKDHVRGVAEVHCFTAGTAKALVLVVPRWWAWLTLGIWPWLMVRRARRVLRGVIAAGISVEVALG